MSISVDINKRLGDFSLEIAFETDAKRIGILGPSGCGKSMTLKSIAGIEKPDSGHISIDERILFDQAQKINLKPQKRRVGYMFQNYALFPTMTVVQNIGAGLGLSDEDRPVTLAARKRAEETGAPALAMELPDGSIVTGKTSSLLGPSAALLLNALKALGGIEKGAHLISPTVIGPIQSLKCDYLGNHNPRLHTDEILLALSICAATDATAARAMEMLPQLKSCEAHSTVILSQVDDNVFRRLKVNLTCDPKYQTKKLYHK